MLSLTWRGDGIQGNHSSARWMTCFELVDVTREEVSEKRATARIVLTLEPVPDYPKTCSQCGQQVATIHDVTPREIRDLPILEAETWLVLPRAPSLPASRSDSGVGALARSLSTHDETIGRSNCSSRTGASH